MMAANNVHEFSFSELQLWSPYSATGGSFKKSIDFDGSFCGERSPERVTRSQRKGLIMHSSAEYVMNLEKGMVVSRGHARVRIDSESKIPTQSIKKSQNEFQKGILHRDDERLLSLADGCRKIGYLKSKLTAKACKEALVNKEHAYLLLRPIDHKTNFQESSEGPVLGYSKNKPRKNPLVNKRRPIEHRKLNTVSTSSHTRGSFEDSFGNTVKSSSKARNEYYGDLTPNASLALRQSGSRSNMEGIGSAFQSRKPNSCSKGSNEIQLYKTQIKDWPKNSWKNLLVKQVNIDFRGIAAQHLLDARCKPLVPTTNLANLQRDISETSGNPRLQNQPNSQA